MEYVLSIDQGTSGSKALIFSIAGEIMASYTASLNSCYPKPGFVEQDGNEIVASVLSAVKGAVSRFEEAGYSKKAVSAAGISNQRESFLLWDRAGNPATPVIVWQCKRSIAVCSRLHQEAGLEENIRQRTGLRIDPYFSGTKLLYLIEEDRDLRARIRAGALYFGTIDTWLMYKLFDAGGAGKRPFYTDPTNASRTLLMDLDTCAWDAGMGDLFGSRGLHLSEIRPSSFKDFSSSTFGGIFNTPIPITAAIGDSHAACFGEGCFSPGTVKATMGTGSSVVMNTGARSHSRHGMVSTVCWSMENRTDYALEGVIVSCASTLNWIQNKLGLAADPKQLDALAESVPDSGGVTFIPAFSGLGGPWWQMDRQAEILGINFGTEAAHIVRAAVEAYPFQLKDVISAMEKDRGAALRWIKADGGLTHSNISMGMIAGLLETEVRIDKRHEASALGAALLAFIGKGSLTFPEVEELARNTVHESYLPGAKLDRELKSSYNRWLQRVRLPIKGSG